jgi:hypothetical protein
MIRTAIAFAALAACFVVFHNDAFAAHAQTSNKGYRTEHSAALHTAALVMSKDAHLRELIGKPDARGDKGIHARQLLVIGEARPSPQGLTSRVRVGTKLQNSHGRPFARVTVSTRQISRAQELATGRKGRWIGYTGAEANSPKVHRPLLLN